MHLYNCLLKVRPVQTSLGLHTGCSVQLRLTQRIKKRLRVGGCIHLDVEFADLHVVNSRVNIHSEGKCRHGHGLLLRKPNCITPLVSCANDLAILSARSEYLLNTCLWLQLACGTQDIDSGHRLTYLPCTLHTPSIRFHAHKVA